MKNFLGYCEDEEPNDDDLSLSDFLQGRNRVYGKKNPHKMNIPFWNAMVRCGAEAEQAENKFLTSKNKYKALSEEANKEPIWCYKRFGKSITALPNGTYIEIGGEHEDFYMPHFCIYNDVFVHKGDGNFDIYTYPRDVFPPTDFHTATLIGKYIYIIGNLGYESDRRIGHTPVYRLDTRTLKIKIFPIEGKGPGWISQHHASLKNAATIMIEGGNIMTLKNGFHCYIKNTHTFYLCLDTKRWKKEDM
jgi:hypothetical protein